MVSFVATFLSQAILCFLQPRVETWCCQKLWHYHKQEIKALDTRGFLELYLWRWACNGLVYESLWSRNKKQRRHLWWFDITIDKLGIIFTENLTLQSWTTRKNLISQTSHQWVFWSPLTRCLQTVSIMEQTFPQRWQSHFRPMWIFKSSNVKPISSMIGWSSW